MRVKVLSVGNLIERKGHRYLIDAALFGGRLGVFWDVVIVGEGPLRQSLLDRWDGDEYCSVQIVPRCTRDRLEAYYDWADCFALPSITDKRGLTEGLGLVVLESLVRHVPVVAFDTGAVRELVQLQGVPALVPEKFYIDLAWVVKAMVLKNAALIDWIAVDRAIAAEYSEDSVQSRQELVLHRILGETP